MKKNVLVIGWYGEGNIGDEAILQSIKNNLTEKFDVNVKALSTRTEYTTRMQGVEAIPHMPLSMKSFVLNFFNIKKSRPAINAIRNSDIILLGGGGFLSASVSKTPSRSRGETIHRQGIHPTQSACGRRHSAIRGVFCAVFSAKSTSA